MSEERKPWWKSDAVIMGVLLTLGQIGIWAISKADLTDTTALAMGGVNSRLDRIFEKLDVLPVMQEHIRMADVRITELRGGYSTLEERLRAGELNAAANHADIQKAGPKR